MKFKVSTSGYQYNGDQAKRRIALGFPLVRNPELDEPRIGGRYVAEYIYNRAIEDLAVEIEFKSLEELEAFGREWGELIIDFKNATVEIYDSSRE